MHTRKDQLGTDIESDQGDLGVDVAWTIDEIERAFNLGVPPGGATTTSDLATPSIER